MEVISATDLNLVITSIDDIVGAAPSTLTTTAKTLVGAINELGYEPDILKVRPWTQNTDANTLGTGIYGIGQESTPQTFNYPAGYGVLVSFITSYFAFQIFGQADGIYYYMRSRSNTTTWSAWRSLTAT